MFRSTLLSVGIFLLLTSSTSAAIIFSENFGSPIGNVSIAGYAGFSNGVGLTFSGTGDLRSTSASSGYPGASGGGNVFLTNSGNRTLQISGINTLGYVSGSFQLSFGAFKLATASDLTHLIVAYSTDNLNFFSLTPTFPAQSTGSGTAVWRQLTMSPSNLPTSGTLSLRFTNTSTLSSVRLDDITLSGTAVPEPATFGIVAALFASFWWNKRRLYLSSDLA